MATISGLSATSQSSLYATVQQYLSLEKTQYNRLQAEQSELTERQSVLTKLGTQLRTLRSAIYDFRWEGSTNPVNTFTATSGDESKVTATATGAAVDGSHVVTVGALAKAHSIASAEFAADEDAQLAGAHTFHLVQDGETYSVTVTVEEGDTYGDVLAALAKALNDSGAQVTASVATVDAKGERRRLLLTSKTTGTAAMIAEVKDDSGELAATLGLKGSSDTEKGFSSNTVQRAADAEFTVDGLAFVSATNRVTGVLTGLTLNLTAIGADPVTVTVERDVAQIRTKIDAFLEAYNALVDHVREQTQGADETGEGRGLFTGETLYTGLRAQVRSAVTADVPDATGQATLRRLSQLGITADREGHLTVSDEDRFEEALATTPGQVQRLFTDEEQGLAVRLVKLMDRYSSTGGLLGQENKAMRSRQRAIADRIEREENYLARREEQLTEQLASLQNTAYQLQYQQQLMDALGGYTS